MAKSYRAVRAEIVGHIEDWRTVWSRLGDEDAVSPVAAGVAGALDLDSDDFVIIEIDDGVIVRALGSDGAELADWGPGDLDEIAGCVGLLAA